LKPDEKPISYVMNFVSYEEDLNDESVKIWGNKWKYLIKGNNLRPVKPFDIDEIKISPRNYGSIQTFGYIDKKDQPIVLDWIGENLNGIFKKSSMEIDLEIGEELSKEEIEDKFNTNFGPRIKGITLRRWEDDTPYILLFSRAAGPYSDKIIEDVLYYDGEGQNKDQELTTANKALIESNETGRTIYGFIQEDEKGPWKYIGILEVLDYSYIKKDGYMKYEFKLKSTGLDIPEYQMPESKEILDLVKDVPKLEDHAVYDSVKRKRRNAAFRRYIKQIYDNTCAVCGKQRFTKTGNPEVEAAHIYPKSKEGSDDLRNGIALCRLHHWAFDNGYFTIDDNYWVVVDERIKYDDNYEEIYAFEGQKIFLPENEDLWPDSLYLVKHREIHGVN